MQLLRTCEPFEGDGRRARPESGGPAKNGPRRLRNIELPFLPTTVPVSATAGQSDWNAIRERLAPFPHRDSPPLGEIHSPTGPPPGPSCNCFVSPIWAYAACVPRRRATLGSARRFGESPPNAIPFVLQCLISRQWLCFTTHPRRWGQPVPARRADPHSRQRSACLCRLIWRRERRRTARAIVSRVANGAAQARRLLNRLLGNRRPADGRVSVWRFAGCRAGAVHPNSPFRVSLGRRLAGFS